MNNFLKTLFTLVLASSAFFIGYFVGQEKVVSKIPNFQEEEEKPM
jgi:hypothetical protein